MINYNKNKLINITLDKYYETFSHTLDTADYVPDNFNNKIYKYIYQNMKKAFYKINKEDNIYQRKLQQKIKLKEKRLKLIAKEEKAKLKAEKNTEKPKNKFVAFVKLLFCRKKLLREIDSERSDD